MHEQGLCDRLLKQVLEIAAQHDAQQVKKVHLRLGPWSTVNAKQLHHAFPRASAGTLAAQAQLHIENSGALIRCLACDIESEVDAATLICPRCQSPRTQILGGDEILITDIEMTT